MLGKEGRQAATPTGVTQDALMPEHRPNSKASRQGAQA